MQQPHFVGYCGFEPKTGKRSYLKRVYDARNTAPNWSVRVHLRRPSSYDNIGGYGNLPAFQASTSLSTVCIAMSGSVSVASNWRV